MKLNAIIRKISWVDICWIILALISLDWYWGADYRIYWGALQQIGSGLPPWTQFGYFYGMGFLAFAPVLWNPYLWFGMVTGMGWWAFRQLRDYLPKWVIIGLMILEFQDLSYGNCNGILFAAVVYYCLHPGEYRSGIIIGLVCFKPNFILILPFVVFQHKRINWDVVIGVAAGLFFNYFPIVMWDLPGFIWHTKWSLTNYLTNPDPGFHLQYTIYISGLTYSWLVGMIAIKSKEKISGFVLGGLPNNSRWKRIEHVPPPGRSSRANPEIYFHPSQ